MKTHEYKGCGEPDCLACALVAVVMMFKEMGHEPHEIMEMTLEIVGDTLGFETAVLESSPAGGSDSVH
jgi:hypothetical protein